MDCIGFSGQEKADIFRVVAAVLHLGNIKFEEETTDRKGPNTDRVILKSWNSNYRRVCRVD